MYIYLSRRETLQKDRTVCRFGSHKVSSIIIQKPFCSRTLPGGVNAVKGKKCATGFENLFDQRDCRSGGVVVHVMEDAVHHYYVGRAEFANGIEIENTAMEASLATEMLVGKIDVATLRVETVIDDTFWHLRENVARTTSDIDHALAGLHVEITTNHAYPR